MQCSSNATSPHSAKLHGLRAQSPTRLPSLQTLASNSSVPRSPTLGTNCLQIWEFPQFYNLPESFTEFSKALIFIIEDKNQDQPNEEAYTGKYLEAFQT